MLPRSPVRGCTFTILGGFEINGPIKLWGNWSGKPYLFSPQLRSCPEIKGPWLNWHHAVLLVPTTVATVAMSSLTGWVSNCSPQHARKSGRLSLKTDLFLRTTHLLLLRRSGVVLMYVLFASQVTPQLTNFPEEEATCSSPIRTFSSTTSTTAMSTTLQ